MKLRPRGAAVHLHLHGTEKCKFVCIFYELLEHVESHVQFRPRPATSKFRVDNMFLLQKDAKNIKKHRMFIFSLSNLHNFNINFNIDDSIDDRLEASQ